VNNAIYHYLSCKDYTIKIAPSLPLYSVSDSGNMQMKYMGSQIGFEGVTISGDCYTCFLKWKTTGWRRCKNPTEPGDPLWVDIGVPGNTLLSCSHNGEHLCATDGSITAYYQLNDGDVMQITLPSPALYSAVLNDASVFIGTNTHVYVVRNGSLNQLLVLSKPCFGVWADATNVWVSEGLFDEVGVWDGATYVSPNGGASWVKQTDALAVGPALYVKDMMHYKMTGWSACSGPECATGPSGCSGLECATGPSGCSGLECATGPSGCSGLECATGPSSCSGPECQTGPSGPTGPTSPKSKTLTYVLLGSLLLIVVASGVAWWMVSRSKPKKETNKNGAV
jgi:hypothetical protein